MGNVKYILIVSQYHYSYHCFVVSASEENFREKALTLIECLEDFKRGESDQRDYCYGSPRENAYTDINVRWNVNDVGDIYFIPCQSMLDVMKRASEYDTGFLLATRYKSIPKKQREKIEDEVFLHHSYDEVKDIVGSVFEIL